MTFAATRMDLEIAILSEILSEVRQRKKKYDIFISTYPFIYIHLYSTYLRNLKDDKMKLFTEQEQTHRHRKQTYGYQGVNVGEGCVRSLGLTVQANAYKIENNKDLLYTTENYTYYLVMTYNRNNLNKNKYII